MIRRKVRPLAAFSAIVVFLLFQFLRNSGTEVFMFDSLPPYTDTDTYVKKPTPIPAVPQEPPPPPPDWGRTRVDVPSSVHENPPPRPEHEAEDERPLRQDPHGQDRTQSQQPDNAVSPGGPQHQHQGDSPHSGDDTTFEQFSGTGGDHDGHIHTIPDQPPVTGDLPKDRFVARPYTPEELAPRIEQYPLSPAEIIHLPSGQLHRLPMIQARFPTESAEQQRIRLQRQAAIKRAMTRSWDAYATLAMGHDEVRPVSGRHHDPFCGWGATLVDSLDTLQIMGLDAEYREALARLERIDFAHTRSRSIPLFETVIRYLGGLLGAYDISGGKDTILLDKAKDLGDMLMGAFDTHNRMPLLRYDWRPQAQRYGLRASENSCLAELGTLSLEFTRLAQLTGNHSYFDAVSHTIRTLLMRRCNGLRTVLRDSNFLIFRDCFLYMLTRRDVSHNPTIPIRIDRFPLKTLRRKNNPLNRRPRRMPVQPRFHIRKDPIQPVINRLPLMKTLQTVICPTTT